MKKHNKILLTIVCAVLLVVTSVLGTLAYLTSQDTVVNTFTVGKVGIELHETGEEPRNDGTVGKDYHLLPGHSYKKDPTVTVLADSEESYIRMLVTLTAEDERNLKNAFPAFVNTDDGVFLLQYLVEGWEPNVWKFAGYAEGTYEFRYYKTVSTDDDAIPLEPLFESVKIPGEIDNAHLAFLDGVQIDVVAHAIQASGFADANAAWAAFATQHP